MDDAKEPGSESQALGGQTQPEGGGKILDTVAGTVGFAVGAIETGAAKVVGRPEQAPPSKKQTAKPKRQASSENDKLSENRAASKKKKRTAHRRKLKRSNSKG